MESRQRDNKVFNGRNVIQAFCLAAIAFMLVVVAHQFLLGGLSHWLGYETRITFSKVYSLPSDNKFWGNQRVLLLYLAPSVLFFVIALIMYWGLAKARSINGLGYIFRFWIMFYCIIFISNLITLSPLAYFNDTGMVYQGFAVIVRWYGLALYWVLLFLAISLALNLWFGVLAYRALIQYWQSKINTKKSSLQRKVILYHFIYPYLMIVPLALFLGGKNSLLYFSSMMLHGLIWVLALFIQVSTGFKGIRNVEPVEAGINYILLALVVIATALIYVFM